MDEKEMQYLLYGFVVGIIIWFFLPAIIVGITNQEEIWFGDYYVRADLCEQKHDVNGEFVVVQEKHVSYGYDCHHDDKGNWFCVHTGGSYVER